MFIFYPKSSEWMKDSRSKDLDFLNPSFIIVRYCLTLLSTNWNFISPFPSLKKKNIFRVFSSTLEVNFIFSQRGSFLLVGVIEFLFSPWLAIFDMQMRCLVSGAAPRSTGRNDRKRSEGTGRKKGRRLLIGGRPLRKPIRSRVFFISRSKSKWFHRQSPAPFFSRPVAAAHCVHAAACCWRPSTSASFPFLPRRDAGNTRLAECSRLICDGRVGDATRLSDTEGPFRSPMKFAWRVGAACER